MLKNFVIIKHITLFILPYIFLYALYIQINGEASSGGGFQAGTIFASTIIGFDLVHGQFKLRQYFSIDLLVSIATIGVLIYALTGMVSILFDDNYLNYYSLAHDKLLAQHIGISIIEIGVGLCVASVMCLIYSIIAASNIIKNDQIKKH
jgi:multicomponent Na+:H+ antiporter subunit B